MYAQKNGTGTSWRRRGVTSVVADQPSAVRFSMPRSTNHNEIAVDGFAAVCAGVDKHRRTRGQEARK